MCHSELRSFQQNLDKFIDAGIRVVGVSVDTTEKTREYMLQKAGYTFTFLSDPKLEAIRRYDLLKRGDRVNQLVESNWPSGTIKVKTVPAPTSLWTLTRPP